MYQTVDLHLGNFQEKKSRSQSEHNWSDWKMRIFVFFFLIFIAENCLNVYPVKGVPTYRGENQPALPTNKLDVLLKKPQTRNIYDVHLSKYTFLHYFIFTILSCANIFSLNGGRKNLIIEAYISKIKTLYSRRAVM